MIKAFEKVSGKKINYDVVGEPGDVISVFTLILVMHLKVKLESEYELDQMCEDTWRWQSLNPRGYD